MEILRNGIRNDNLVALTMLGIAQVLRLLVAIIFEIPD